MIYDIEKKDYIVPKIKRKNFNFFTIILNIFYYSFRYVLNLIYLEKLLLFFKSKFEKKIIMKNNLNFNFKRLENVKLHGSCLIFSKKFIEKHVAFYPETFLYLEEDILFYNVRKYKLRSIFNPEIKVVHVGDASINMVKSNDYIKRRYIYRESINSLLVFLKYL